MLRNASVSRIGVGVALLAMTVALAACGPAQLDREPSLPAEPIEAASSGSLRVLMPTPTRSGDIAAHTARTLRRVARARRLAVLSEVKAERMDKARASALVRENVARNMPRDSLVGQGELLRGLGLISAEFDFADELVRFATAELAGLYDPERKTLFVLEGLGGPEAEHTLLHELAHALHDQHFDLGARMRLMTRADSFGPDGAAGAGDSVAAQHAMAEGDATAVAFTVQHGEVPDAEEMRDGMLDGLAKRRDIPEVVRRSMVSPYCDGLAFVTQLRERGGWAAVDAAWRRPPRSTEQLLHLDKYRDDEAPLSVALVMPTDGAWSLLDSDVLGEMALRAMFAQWTGVDNARRAAAGWGGDRYAVMRRNVSGDDSDYWLSLRMVFDTSQDAQEAHAVIAGVQPKACRNRATVGPLAHARRGVQLALVAGPYRWAGGQARALADGDCALAQAWLSQTLASAPTRATAPNAERALKPPKKP